MTMFNSVSNRIRVGKARFVVSRPFGPLVEAQKPWTVSGLPTGVERFGTWAEAMEFATGLQIDCHVIKRFYYRFAWWFHYCRGCRGFDRSVSRWRTPGGRPSWYCFECALKKV